jgi:hypothetical protein
VKVVTTIEIQYLVLIYSGDTGNVAGLGGVFSTYEQAETAIDELRGDYFASQFSIQPLEVDKVEVTALYPEEPEEEGCPCGCD